MSEDHSATAHYDRVTRAWRLLLGEELHYGVFTSPGTPLRDATGELTRRMIDAARLEPGLRVLDIGCGTGAPACRLAEEYDVEVLGISTSEVGVEDARRRAAERGLERRVRFEVRDGTDSGLPDRSFDRVWVLEASHLMPERDRLIAEAARVLRPGGRFVLCDIIRRRKIPFTELRRRTAEFATLREAFGEARMDPLGSYAELLADAGLTVDRSDDLSDETLPTFAAWRANAATHADRVREALGEDGLSAFIRSADILESLWRDGTLGYGLIAAEHHLPLAPALSS